MDQPQTVIIDGYNLIKRVPALTAKLSGASGLESARSYLLGWLRSYQARRGRRVVLVLDGPRTGRSDFGPVEVYYAPEADEVVVRLSASGCLVVSSDLAVQRSALAQGAEVLASEDFWQALVATASPAPRRTRESQDAGDSRRPKSPKGNPRRKSKAQKRREQARIDLMRKV